MIRTHDHLGFAIGAPYRAIQTLHLRRWRIYGTRQGVSAQVWYPVCNIVFRRKRDAVAVARDLGLEITR